MTAPNTIYRCRNAGWYRRVVRLERDAARRQYVIYEGRKRNRHGELIVKPECKASKDQFENTVLDEVDAWPEELVG